MFVQGIIKIIIIHNNAVGKPANCIIMNNDNFYNALNEHSEVLYSIRHGKVLVETKPKEVKLNF